MDVSGSSHPPYVEDNASDTPKSARLTLPHPHRRGILVNALHSMQEDAEKLDELLSPIEITNEINRISEQLVPYDFQVGETGS